MVKLAWGGSVTNWADPEDPFSCFLALLFSCFRIKISRNLGCVTKGPKSAAQCLYWLQKLQTHYHYTVLHCTALYQCVANIRIFKYILLFIDKFIQSSKYLDIHSLDI